MIFIFLVLGLIIGSFVNVLIYRVHSAEELIWDRSKCPHCQHQIRWYDNIPVLSFLLLKSRCRDCREKISWQYPIVEIFTGLIFAFIGYKFFNFNDFSTWILTLYYFIATGILITILVYDWLYLEIPAIVLWVAIFIAIVFGLYFDWASLSQNVIIQRMTTNNLLNMKIYSGVLAALVAFLFFFSLSVFSKEKWMGMGDAYLVIFLGLLLGFPKIVLALFLAFFIGAIYGIVMLSLKKKEMKSQIPFAPFLVVGTFITLFFYAPIIQWYIRLFWNI